MKIASGLSSLLIILLTSINSIDAATITWLGGNGAWNDATQWDTGTIPILGDDVVINTGRVKLYSGDSEKASSVIVHALARLYIYNGAELEISGTVDNNGLRNIGRVLVYGDLAIKEISQTNSGFSAKAILNQGVFLTYNNSQINIKHIDDIAIENDPISSYFRVRGGLWIYDVSNTAILNHDLFVNYGTIDIEDSGLNSGAMIVNTDEFRNQSSGEINLNSEIYGGFSNAGYTPILHNHGSIHVDNVTIGLINQGEVFNYTSGSIEAENNFGAGIDNRIEATLTNDGHLKTINSDPGINNYGTIINNNSLSILFSSLQSSIINYSSGFIQNYDYIYLGSTGFKDLYNEGDIFNYYGGHIAFNKIIDLNTTGVLANFGFLTAYGSSSHTINGTLLNNGVIDDDYGQLQSQVSNNRLIVAPVSGPMQVGVAYPNVLDITSLINVSIGDWKVSPLGIVAGTYDESTNEFTPNASAVGISKFYISIADLVSGNTRYFTLEIDTPVLPFTKKMFSPVTRNDHDADQSISASSEVNIYPNPTSGHIQLESEAFMSNQVEVQIFNNIGQLVQRIKLDNESKNQSVDFSNHLTNGIYFVKIIQEGVEISMEKVLLNR